MLRTISAALAVAAITVPAGTATANQQPSAKGSASASAAPNRQGCQTASCHRRVAAKRRRADARWCQRNRACRTRVAAKRAATYKQRVVAPYLGWLIRLGRCESGNNPRTNTGNGYYGEFQFDLQTWRSVGGWGFPHQNSRLEQRFRAVKLRQQRGTAPWPVCG
jgi:hypothetical protein